MSEEVLLARIESVLARWIPYIKEHRKQAALAVLNELKKMGLVQ